MNISDIKELITLINESNLSEFKMKSEDIELLIRTDKYERNKSSQAFFPPQPSVIPMPQTAAVTLGNNTENGAVNPVSASAEPEGKAASNEEDSNQSDQLLTIKSPIVGTFYRSPTPEKPAYAKVGDVIEAGSVVCIIEAMKLFNEIEAEFGGKVVKVLVEDAQPVEYDQPLFLVDPNG